MMALLQKLVHAKGYKRFPVYEIKAAKVKVSFTLEQAMKPQRRSRVIGVVFL
jgi:hypothetical protein